MSSAVSAAASSCSSPSSPSSEWAQLPAELLSLVVSCVSFRGVLRLAAVDHRLHRLILQPGSSGSSQSDVWRDYPPVNIVRDEHIRRGNIAREDCIRDFSIHKRTVTVGDERLDDNVSGVDVLSAVLAVLQSATALRITFDRTPTDRFTSVLNVPPSRCPSLHHSTRLRALTVAGFKVIAADSVAAALDQLPSLVSLELHAFDTTADEHLTPPLYRLCSQQLNHLTVCRRQLLFLVHHQHQSVPHLRSLTVTSSPDLTDDMGRPLVVIDSTWPAQFPSLTHLAVSDNAMMRELKDALLPPLSSFTAQVHNVAMQADFSQIHTRMFRLGSFEEYNTPGVVRELMCRLLSHAPSVQQLSIADSSNEDAISADNSSLFPPALPRHCFRDLVYLDFLCGLTLADLAYLLNPASLPVFAGQLTHLALGVHQKDRAAAAMLLPSLPSIYPSLTHVGVDVLAKRSEAQLDECAEWSAAVQAIRAAVGSAWCASVSDVVQCREDVAWRRENGLSLRSRIPHRYGSSIQ